MLNDNIINEFEKLINFVKSEHDKYKKNKDVKNTTANMFRLKQLNNVLIILKNYPTKINLDNVDELKTIDGIGNNTIQRIKEILQTNKLSELDNFVHSTEKEDSLKELESIVGVGRSKANEFYDMGITTIKMLKKKIKNKEIEVNEKIELGLKYYGKYETNIPRAEITKFYKIIKKIITKINKNDKLNDDSKYIFEICGSYRREKQVSGDIDVLISKLNNDNNTNHLKKIITYFKENIKDNNNMPLLVDDITDKNFETKYMGFAQLKENPIRRIDIRYIPYDSYYSALLYFTGSAELNKKMRIIAKNKGYKLSEYGLFKDDGTKLDIKSEEDMFKKLNMDYIEPKFR
jgi:DNA polymerase/3'-5' exonuclease PolX